MQTYIVLIACVILLLCLFFRVPVYISVFAAALTYFLFQTGSSPAIIAQRIGGGIQSIPLLAIPFFICAGIFMNSSGVTKRIMNFCNVVTKRMTGGLGQVNVLLSTLMGGLSGSNLADAAMEAKILVPEMEEKGYSKEFSSVLTATSAMITPLIPPGIGMILYGSIANVSIGKLFVAGIGIGVLLCISLMIMVHFISKKRGYQPATKEKQDPEEVKSAVKQAILPLCLPILIIGGIRIGIVTPTEAGTVAIVYALILGIIYKELKMSDVVDGLKESVATTASIMMIVGGASAFAWVLTKERIPQQLTEVITSSISNKYVFLIIVILFLLVVGMFIEGNAAMIVLVPLLAPVAQAYGINEIHFAMLFIFVMAVGGVTPPMGTLIFVTCGVTKYDIKAFIKESMPFYIMLLILMLGIAFIPALSTGLVNLVY